MFAFSVASAQPTSTEGREKPADASNNLAEATQEYQVRSAELVRMQESEISKATVQLDGLRQLVAEGLVAKVELEQGEQ